MRNVVYISIELFRTGIDSSITSITVHNQRVLFSLVCTAMQVIALFTSFLDSSMVTYTFNRKLNANKFSSNDRDIYKLKRQEFPNIEYLQVLFLYYLEVNEKRVFSLCQKIVQNKETKRYIGYVTGFTLTYYALDVSQPFNKQINYLISLYVDFADEHTN